MLNWIIDFSLRHRLLVILCSVLALAVVGRPVAALSGHRCLSRHDAGAGADQHGRAVARAGRSRAADHVSDRAGDRRPAGPGEHAVASRSSASRRSSSRSRTAPTSTSPGSWSTSGWRPSSCRSGIERPKMGPVATGLGEVFHYVVTGKGNDVTELRTIHDWVIKPKMRTVKGAAEINSWGGYEKQYQVRIDPEPAHQVRPDVRRSGRGRRREQSQRRRRQHPRRNAVGARAGPGPHDEHRADQRHRRSRPRTACRFASATWPRWRSAPRFAAAR